MELTGAHLRMIKEVAKEVEYGSITINISATSDKLDLNVQKRIRIHTDDVKNTLNGMQIDKASTDNTA